MCLLKYKCVHRSIPSSILHTVWYTFMDTLVYFYRYIGIHIVQWYTSTEWYRKQKPLYISKQFEKYIIANSK